MYIAGGVLLVAVIIRLAYRRWAPRATRVTSLYLGGCMERACTPSSFGWHVACNCGVISQHFYRPLLDKPASWRWRREHRQTVHAR